MVDLRVEAIRRAAPLRKSCSERSPIKEASVGSTERRLTADSKARFETQLCMREDGGQASLEAPHLYCRSAVLPCGRSFHGDREADLGLAFEAYRVEGFMCPDQVVAALPSLALFSVPMIVLEPIKPLAAYLAATGRILSSFVTLIVGELLKLVLVERLFSLR